MHMLMPPPLLAVGTEPTATLRTLQSCTCIEINKRSAAIGTLEGQRFLDFPHVPVDGRLSLRSLNALLDLRLHLLAHPHFGRLGTGIFPLCVHSRAEMKGDVGRGEMSRSAACMLTCNPTPILQKTCTHIRVLVINTGGGLDESIQTVTTDEVPTRVGARDTALTQECLETRHTPGRLSFFSHKYTVLQCFCYCGASRGIGGPHASGQSVEGRGSLRLTGQRAPP
mmetsp:Transcript_10461/g.20302  ORF Transcript_10461/g.20302 Transcript_10461/m.20302 type:complete len:225 (+) Transcript_10461:1119-1793(+)